MILEELKEILGDLYATLGLTGETLRLSMIVDKLINQEMNK